MSAAVNVLAVLDREIADIAGLSNLDDAGELALRERELDLRQARAAVAELIEADREHDAARIALIDINRKVAEHGWIDVEFDALRNACERFVGAQIRRDRALAKGAA